MHTSYFDGLFQATAGITLPKVKVRRIASKNVGGSIKPFDLPKNYIKFRVRPNKEMDNILEYDVDEEDMEWLEIVSQKLEINGEEPLSIHDFEMTMDRLEKESFFQVIIFCILKIRQIGSF
ncbi:unnamed protein product [Gongylonema pulchrum]|uniref:Enhancer of polycomb-like protein n=1 Tax=Gongylonema pulchrum TaxID=637853 RepID=A0A183ERQ6_9BILA|nr:unnamed protein product [Gongylonema pulchrum]